MKNDWQKDACDEMLPFDLKSFELGPSEFVAGQRIGWWYKDDERFEKEFGGENPRKNPPYSGIVVPKINLEMRGNSFDTENAIVVVCDYPVEKCYPEVYYIAYRRLLADVDLAGIVILKKGG